MKKIIRLLKETFIRKHFYLHDYFCQTNTFKESWMVFKQLFSSKSLKYGEYIYNYEKKASKVMGAKYTYSYASGRQSLYVILKALEIGEGDEVVIQGFTCVAVPRAIIYSGAIPIYCDIDSTTFNMDYNKISFLITNKTKAVIVQHTFGNMADIEKLQKYLWNKKTEEGGGLYIIEDFAHAVGCGKLKGDVGFYSSDHTKMISTSTGGMAFTNDIDIRRGLDKNWLESPFLSNFRILQIAFTFIVEIIITYPKIYWLLRPLRIFLDKTRIFFFFRDENKIEKPKNYPLRLSNLQAAIGISQLDNLDDQLKKRKLFAVNGRMLRDVYLGTNIDMRNKFIEVFNKYNSMGYWFNSPVFGCKDLSTVYYVEGSCPVAEKVCEEIINLPIPLR